MPYQPKRGKRKILFRLFEEFGTDLGMPRPHQIKGRLWELRPGDNRLFYFLQVERKFIVLHGYRRRTMRAPEKEITTALRRMQEFLEK